MKIFYVVPLLLLVFVTQSANAVTLPGIPEFIDEMVAKHKFKRAELESVFEKVQHVPAVIEAISRPATIKPWLEYRAAFVNPSRIKRGLEFWHRYRNTLLRAERKYGVPQEIIVAVIGVETVYGKDAGTFRTIDALTTLAFDYPRRADFFRSELESYLLLAREQQFDLLAIKGSYAGAMGIPQFMPSSYRNYAVDFNGNHKIDLLHESRDAIGSVANYLQSYGWDSSKPKPGNSRRHAGKVLLKQPIAVLVQVGEMNHALDAIATHSLGEWASQGVVPDLNINQDQAARLMDFTVVDGKEFWLAFNNFDVITRYNNSDFYAMSVFQLAQALKAAHKKQATASTEALNK